MENTAHKTHFRKVYKSDHLGVADLEDLLEEGKRLVFKIREVKQELGVNVAGKKGNFNIAYFEENIKPLVLNATNAAILKLFSGSSFVEDWKGLLIELYIDQGVMMKGQVVGGVRIMKKQPIFDNGLDSQIALCKDVAELQTLFTKMSKEQQQKYKVLVTERKKTTRKC
ncbi:hypothetical protein [Chryseobacterium proteolyticum]|uniref:hypothetical protein n=1 Tax=Chryseobacterium proteolyticum TaxID=118127 RepID=UPI003982EEDD